jgi:hypothetical protein
MRLIQNKTVRKNPQRRAFCLAKDKQTKGSKSKLGSRIRTRAHNLVSQAPGVLAKAKNAKSVLHCWEIRFPDDMIDQILKNTNNEIERKK